MLLSTAGALFICSWERCWKPTGDGRFAAYMPTPNDRPTIGYGTTGPDVKMGMEPWTLQQCQDRFGRDSAAFAVGLMRLLHHEPTQAQFDAMVSLAYNIGMGHFTSSSVLRHFNAGEFDAARASFALWNKQTNTHGVLEVLDGLTARRAQEAAMFAGLPFENHV